MKAIKDCEWEVTLAGNWLACYKSIEIISSKIYKNLFETKRNWEKFARLNKIKKWRYV